MADITRRAARKAKAKAKAGAEEKTTWETSCRLPDPVRLQLDELIEMRSAPQTAVLATAVDFVAHLVREDPGLFGIPDGPAPSDN